MKEATIYSEQTRGTREESFMLIRVDEFTYALPLDWVQKIIPSILFRRLPDAPSTIRGIINLHGEPIPLLNLRKRFGHPEREVMETDKFVLLRSARISVAIEADEIFGVSTIEVADTSMLHSLLPGLTKILPGAGIHRDELILLYDMEEVFINDVEQTLDLCRKVQEVKSRKKS